MLEELRATSSSLPRQWLVHSGRKSVNRACGTGPTRRPCHDRLAHKSGEVAVYPNAKR